ncbi:MAG: endonuclease III domain-containing protein [Candidatus Zipacnadales bacterium]
MRQHSRQKLHKRRATNNTKITAFVRTVHQTLLQIYGRPPPQRRANALDVLVETILSQNTAAANARQAFRELRRRFPTWEECLNAPSLSVIEAIRRAGLAEVRGPRIQQVLQEVLLTQGKLSLDMLHELPPKRGMMYLQSLPGVGPKTAACVLLFACRKQVFPVDTHVARLSYRLGWLSEKVPPGKAQLLLEPLVPPPLRYPLHVNLITHGRAICHARNPTCEHCALLVCCPTGKEGWGE